jgi:iron complex outermembrane receptor protein
VPNTFYTNNPYLPAAAQAQLANPSGTFKLAEYFNDQGPNGGFQSNSLNANLNLTTGVDGSLFNKYNWNVYYTHGENRLKVSDPHNQNNQLMYASEDAALNSSGQVVCNVSTTVYASSFPGCVPMNPFGPTALTNQAWNYFTQNTYYIATNDLDDVGGSISGNIFDAPAGPVKAALSGEMRWLSYAVNSNAQASDFVNCTGLRLCSSATPLWQGNIISNSPKTSENVWEFAAEADVPILKDIPLVQSLDTNVAGRYTDYSTSGAVQTWKIGLDYHVDDSVRFRATTSIDIRAPTLNDLYSPLQTATTGYIDLHTGNTQGTIPELSQGNPNLVPEVARTYTAGVVLTPSFFPGFSTSVDYYNIVLKNAISTIAGTSTSIQQLCESSGGSSPYCALAVRPLAFSNTTPANFPTQVLSEELNTAFEKIEGLDIEANYGFKLSSIADSLPGSMTLRALVNIQPVNNSELYPGAPITWGGVPKGRLTGFINYTIGSWTFAIEDRWLSGFTRSTQQGLIYEQPTAPQVDYVDLNIDKVIQVDDISYDAYLSIQNLVNVEMPIIPTNEVSPGLYYAGGQGANTGYDAIGRYFTIGLRARL